MHINLHFDCVVSPRPDNWRKITILLRHQSSSPLPLFSTLPLNKSVEMGVEVAESETISSARLHHITRPGCGDHCKVLCLRNFSPMFEGVWSQAPGQGGDGEWRSGGRGTDVIAAADWCPQSGPAPAAAYCIAFTGFTRGLYLHLQEVRLHLHNVSCKFPR